MKKILVALIALYQKTFSLDHGPLKGLYPHGFCHFYPSCSEYAKEAIMEYGSVKGLYMSFVRILKCNPFTHPKIDKI